LLGPEGSDPNAGARSRVLVVGALFLLGVGPPDPMLVHGWWWVPVVF
jgi:hypothetical protein